MLSNVMLKLDEMVRIVNDKGELFYAKKETDDFPLNPRTDFDGNLGEMVCWNRRYTLGDTHSWTTPDDFVKHLMENFCNVSAEEVDELNAKECMDRLNAAEDVFILPLYLLDHSGITMSVEPFNDPWDSGQIGWIYATRDKARELWGEEPESDWKVRAREEMISEVETYDQYIRNDIYSVRIFSFLGTEKEAKKVEKELKNTEDGLLDPALFDWFEEEQCGGFFGDDDEKSGLLDFVREIIE